VMEFTPKNYENDHFALMEGYRGELVINKVYNNKALYSFVNPIVQVGSIYVLYDKIENCVYCYATDVRYNPHIHNRALSGYSLVSVRKGHTCVPKCDGNIRFYCTGRYLDDFSHCDMDKAIESCTGVVDIFKTINVHEMANMDNIPDEYRQSIYDLKELEEPDKDLFRKLL
jgi:hypothetical protein